MSINGSEILNGGDNVYINFKQ